MKLKNRIVWTMLLSFSFLSAGSVYAAAKHNEQADETVSSMPRIEAYPLLQKANMLFMQKLSTTVQKDCPEVISGRHFPLPEPEYNGKRGLDLGMYQGALAGFGKEKAKKLDALLKGKSIAELQQLMESKTLSAEQLLLYYVDRIKRYDINRLNSVLELNPEGLEIARQLDREREEGKVRGPMHGIPVLLKDNIATGDKMHTTAGAAVLQDWVAGRDAFLVKKIREAGGIILGKANLSEWANYLDPCMPSGFSALGGQTRHPYGPFDPLGSSTGSAVAVAAGFSSVSVGSETSGSLIQPARVNSLVALRPSQGLVSRDYVIPLGEQLDSPGPMGRSIADVAILLSAMSGVDKNDPKSSDASMLAATDFTTYLSLEEAKKLKVGVLLFDETIAATKKALEKQEGKSMSDEDLQSVIPLVVAGNPFQAIKALESQGIAVVRIKQADLPQDVDTAQPQLLYGFNHDLNNFLNSLGKAAPIAETSEVVAFNKKNMADRAPYNQRFVEWSVHSELTAKDQQELIREAQEYAKKWMKSILATYNVDVLVTGTAYSGNAGAAGVPALTIPAGLDATGQPTGLILSGDYLSEPKLLAVGYALEKALHGRVEPDLEKVITTFPNPDRLEPKR